jgi:hypothetical protein
MHEVIANDGGQTPPVVIVEEQGRRQIKLAQEEALDMPHFGQKIPGKRKPTT